MSPSSRPDPDLRATTGAFLAAGAPFVVIGGFAVIAHDYVRATEDVDFLIPSDPGDDGAFDAALGALGAVWPQEDDRAYRAGEIAGREHTRLRTNAGLIDLLRDSGVPPLDFATVLAGAVTADLGDGPFALAGLESLVAFKRLAGRPRDRLDLEELEARHGPLPVVPLPGHDER